MSQQKPPAGWYDDPSGSGGRRYWDGNGWTQRTQAGTTPSRTTATGRSRDRLPDGYMLLNGERVPLGQMTPPASRAARPSLPHLPPKPSMPSANSSATIAVVVLIALIAGLFILGVSSSEDDSLDLGGSYDALDETQFVIEVESRNDDAVELSWYDGDEWFDEGEIESATATPVEVLEDEPLYVRVRPTDSSDIATCRILDEDDTVLDESTSASPGGPAVCSWE